MHQFYQRDTEYGRFDSDRQNGYNGAKVVKKTADCVEGGASVVQKRIRLSDMLHLDFSSAFRERGIQPTKALVLHRKTICKPWILV